MSLKEILEYNFLNVSTYQLNLNNLFLPYF